MSRGGATPKVVLVGWVRLEGRHTIRWLRGDPEVTPTMHTRPYDRWRDADGTPIPAHCRIEHIAVGKEHGALPSRLYQQGHVLGRGTTRLTVQFDHENKRVSIRPHLVCVLITPGGR